MSAVLIAADGVNVAQNVGFGIIAAAMIFAALNVVTTKNVVHAALWLVVVLAGVAAQYILAAAEFVAASQVLVYIGAVMVLFLFGIMLTRAQIGKESDLNNTGWIVGIPVGLVLFGLLAWVVLDAYGDDVLPDRGPAPTVGLSDQFLSIYLVPFIAISFVLLAAAIGAIVLARKDSMRRERLMLAVNFLLLAAALFAIGVYGVIARRNAVMVLMSIELILNAVSLNLVAFSLMTGAIDGQVFALYVIAIAAAEVGVGLAMVLMIYRNRRTIALDELSEMKG